MNLSQIETTLSRNIIDYFLDVKPKHIFETGCYNGMGSTKLIATLIRNIPIPDAKFYSIECNSNNVSAAMNNLVRDGLMPYVSLTPGLSIPRKMLPGFHAIQESIDEARKSEVVVDHGHDAANAAMYYHTETEKFDLDDRISDVMSLLHQKPDFILLDSAGHLGKIEFDYVVSKLSHPCAIALDDTRHLKHYLSRKMILDDSRFEVLTDNEEKFGSMLVKFIPK